MLKNTKTITKQAMAYAIVNLINILSIVAFPLFMHLSAADISKSPPFLQIICLSLRPLQGLFNAIIFIVLKVYSFQRIDPTINVLSALKRLLRSA